MVSLPCHAGRAHLKIRHMTEFISKDNAAMMARLLVEAVRAAAVDAIFV